jgi:transcription elongation factor GreA
MAKEVLITEQGLISLKKELDNLKMVKRPEILEALKEARALGDLSENAEYDAARNDQAVTEARIKELEVMIDNAKVIKDKNTDKVGLGNKVTLEYVKDKEKDVYYIVGSTESDPFANKISNESPIAQAIIGKKKNDVVTVESPNGEYQVKIMDIE